MLNHLLDNVHLFSLAGVGKALFIVLKGSQDLLSDNQKAEVEAMLEPVKNTPRYSDIHDLFLWIYSDEISQETKGNPENKKLVQEYRKLQREFSSFYIADATQVMEKNKAFQLVADFNIQSQKYVLQIMRMRMVIEPEIHITRNVHPLTKIPYLSVKGYWIDDDGRKVRKYTKSLGKAEAFPKGIRDKSAHVEGQKLIQEVLREVYKSTYP